jgi:O-antigen biosynthesis protein WbqP
MFRLLDFCLSLLGLMFGAPVLLAIYLFGLLDTGSPLFRQQRVGRGQKPFTLVKFRTMRPDTESVASHLADASAITEFGAFLRRTKLDELPQLWNVLTGDMSLVGPRPCLVNQFDLIRERASRGVFNVRPGITGLAQLSGVDMSTPEQLAETDAKMLADLSISSYLKYVILTAIGKGCGDAARSR